MEELLNRWEEILFNLKEEYEIMDPSFNTWLKPITPHSIEGNTLYILVPIDQMAIVHIKRKYYNQLKVVIAETIGKEYNLEFVLEEDAPKTNTKMKRLDDSDLIDEKSNLNPNYTFDSFVVGPNNRFAHAASLAVAESPGEVYNPLFIHGGVGLGKTHLMHSIAHYIKKNNPSLKVLYVTSETFTNEVIDSIRNGSSNAMSEFRNKYRKIDVLLVDDIQFIIGKTSTQEEFFHTFNELHLASKQIILSSDRPPKEMEILEERIRTRFESGLLADIGIPDYETRMAILRKKQEEDGIQINDEILNYIATNIKNSVRELEGALNKLVALSNLEKKEITLEIAESELKNIISPEQPKEITAQYIIEVVTDHFQLSMDQMISKARSKDVSIPRQIAMYLCKNMATGYSLEAIGKLLGDRDHTTVMHGAKTIGEQLQTDEQLRNTIETIKKKLNPS